MNRKQRVIATVVVFSIAAFGMPAAWLRWADRQERLNQDLIAAVNKDDTNAASHALALGADPNARDSSEESGQERFWSSVLHRPPRTTPLYTALMYRSKDNPELVRVLLKHGGRDTVGFPPLFYALFMGKTATAHMLLESYPKSGNRFLACAVDHGNEFAIIEQMLQQGADPNLADDGGVTPLIHAVRRDDVAVVRCLIRSRVNVLKSTRAPHDVLYPLEYAEKLHSTKIAKLLRDAGAKRWRKQP